MINWRYRLQAALRKPPVVFSQAQIRANLRAHFSALAEVKMMGMIALAAPRRVRWDPPGLARTIDSIEVRLTNGYGPNTSPATIFTIARKI